MERWPPIACSTTGGVGGEFLGPMSSITRVRRARWLRGAERTGFLDRSKRQVTGQHERYAGSARKVNGWDGIPG